MEFQLAGLWQFIPVSYQNGSQPSKKQKAGENGSLVEETIHRIANQIENREDIAKQN